MRTVLMVAILVGAAATAAAQDRLADQLRKGIVQEEASQNLDKAIQAYRAIVAQYDEERKAAGTALYRLAECYRKAGKHEQADAAYQRVLREFSDQGAIVESSRQQVLHEVRPETVRPSAVAADALRAEVRRKAEVRAAERPMEVTPERPAGSPEETKLDLELLEKRMADVRAKVEIGVAAPLDYQALQATYQKLKQRYEQQLNERQASERAAQEERLLTQNMMKSVQAEILLVQERIADIEKRVAAGLVSTQDSELLQLKRDLLGLQRTLDQLRAGLKR
jgi:tetratricopeptide (TPR) repeat protein